jgi:hypothetical protein
MIQAAALMPTALVGVNSAGLKLMSLRLQHPILFCAVLLASPSVLVRSTQRILMRTMMTRSKRKTK